MLQNINLSPNSVCSIKSVNSEPLLSYLSLGKKHHSPEFLVISNPYITNFLTDAEIDSILVYIAGLRELQKKPEINRIMAHHNLSLSSRQSLNKTLKILHKVSEVSEKAASYIEELALDLRYIRTLQQRFWENRIKLPSVKVLEKMLKNSVKSFEAKYDFGLCLKVTKKHGSAVKRNRLKRLIRAGFSSAVKELYSYSNTVRSKEINPDNSYPLPGSKAYYLIIPKLGAHDLDSRRLQNSLRQCLIKSFDSQ